MEKMITTNASKTPHSRPQKSPAYSKIRRRAPPNIIGDDFNFEDSKCIRFITLIVCKIPVLLVCFIVGGDTYLLYGYSRLVLIEEMGVIATYLLILIYTICISFLLTSYFKCMLTSCAVKDNPPPNDFDESNCPVCKKCGNLKPPRAHHCSLCGTCILKMDHHCPWVGNCVGLFNYKYFLIFLFWVTLASAMYGLLTGIAMFKSYASFGSMIGLWTVLSLFITASFSLSVGGFFFFHIHLLKENKTTLESMQYKNSSPFGNKGNKESFNDIFGDDPWLWFVPVLALKETGYEMHENNSVSASLLQETDDTDENDDDAKNGDSNEEPEVINLSHKIEIGPNPFSK